MTGEQRRAAVIEARRCSGFGHGQVFHLAEARLLDVAEAVAADALAAWHELDPTV
jgi:hypothetical protein